MIRLRSMKIILLGGQVPDRSLMARRVMVPNLIPISLLTIASMLMNLVVKGLNRIDTIRFSYGSQRHAHACAKILGQLNRPA